MAHIIDSHCCGDIGVVLRGCQAVLPHVRAYAQGWLVIWSLSRALGDPGCAK